MTETTESPKVTPLTETVEFKAAVQHAIDKALPNIVKMIDAARGTVATSDDTHFAEKMAMAIAQLTDQGTGRKRIAPEILQQRAKAADRMVKLLIDARAKGNVPSYGMRNKAYLDEVLVYPSYIAPDHTQHQTEIDWPGVPNEAMVPINEVAKEIFAAYKESIGSIDKVVPDDILSVTPGGLTVRGGSRTMQKNRPLGTMEDRPDQPTSGTGGLSIKHKQNRPGQHKEINVLGTVAAPARQQA